MDNNIITTVTLIDGSSVPLNTIAAAYTKYVEVLQLSNDVQAATAAAAGVLTEALGGITPNSLAVAKAMQDQALATQNMAASTQVATKSVEELAAAQAVEAERIRLVKQEWAAAGVNMRSYAEGGYILGALDSNLRAGHDQMIASINKENDANKSRAQIAATVSAINAQEAAVTGKNITAIDGFEKAVVKSNLAVKESALILGEEQTVSRPLWASITQGAQAFLSNTGAAKGNKGALDDLTDGHIRLHQGLLSSYVGITAFSVAALAAGAAILTVTKSQMDWQNQLMLLQNNTASTDETIQSMSRSILQMSVDFAGNSDSMVKGARHIMDYGFQGADAITIMAEATKLASATGAEEEHVAQTVAQALHQYGLGASSAAEFTNTLYAESLRANSTVEQFGQSIFRVSGLAAAVGVPFDQATAAVSALTRQLGNSAQAQTQVLNVMRFILKPTADEAKAWDDLSKRAGDAAISSKNLGDTLSREGLTGILERVKAAMDKLGLSQTQMASESFDLINAQRGGLGMFALLTTATEDYKGGIDAAKAANDGVGLSQEALNRRLETGQAKWDQLGAAMHKATAAGGEWDKAAGNFADGLRRGADALGTLFNMMTLDTSSKQYQDDLKRLGMSLEELDAADKKAIDTTGYFDKVSVQVARDIGNESDQLKQQANAAKMAQMAIQQLNTQTGLLGKAFNELGSLKGMGVTDTMVRQITDQLNHLNKTLGEKGAEAAGAYAQQMIDRFSSLPPQARAALDPLLLILQQFVDIAGSDGADASNLWGSNLADGLASYKDDVQSILDQYSTAADMRGLFRDLGIQTGDNFAQNLDDRIAAWFDPYKATLLKYLQAAEITAKGALDAIGKMVNALKPLVGPLENLPFVGPKIKGAIDTIVGQATTNAMAPVADAEAAIAKLNSLAASVGTARNAKVAEHDAEEAKKNKPKKPKADTGAQPANAAYTEDQRREAVDEATAKLNALLVEAKLRDERAAVTAATKELTNTQNLWNKLLKGESDLIKQAAKDHKVGMASLNNDIKMSSAALEEMKTTHEQVTHDMEEQLYKYRLQLQGVQDDAEAALAPLKALAERDAEAIANLNKETQKADDAFRHQAEAVSDNQYIFEKFAKALMGPYDAALKSATANTEAATDAVNLQQEAVAVQQDGVEKQQEAIQKLADKYANELLPVENELRDLQQEEQADQRSKKIDDEAQSVGNLQSRLAGVVKGSAEYYRIQKQLAEAQKGLSRDGRIDVLTKEKEGIESKRDAALKAANDELKSLQAQLKASQEVLKSRQADLKAAQEVQKQAEKSRTQEAELLDKRRQELAEEAALIQRQQELYDRQQRDKLTSATAQKDSDDAVLAHETATWNATEALINHEIDGVTRKEAAYQHDAGEEERIQGQKLTALTAEKTKRDDNYNAWVDQENEKLDTMQTNADAAIKIASDNVTTLQAVLDTDQENKDKQDFLDKLKVALNNVDDAIQKADLPIKIKGVGTEASGLSDASRDAATNAIALAKALINDLSPAINNLGTTTGTGLDATTTEWQRVFSTTGTDPKNIRNSIFGHSPTSFFTNFDSQTATALGWSKGVWNGKLIELANVVIDGNLTPMAANAKLGATTVGQSIDDGFIQGMDNNKQKVIDKAKEIVGAALDGAAKSIEASSPSKKAARMIGQPIYQGVIAGMERGRVDVNASLRGLVNGAVESVRIPHGAPAAGGSGSISMGGITLNLQLPNVMKMPTDPNDYRQAASAIMYAIKYEADRRGLKRLVLEP